MYFHFLCLFVSPTHLRCVFNHKLVCNPSDGTVYFGISRNSEVEIMCYLMIIYDLSNLFIE